MKPKKTLTVAELIELLRGMPQDAPVYVEGSEWDHDATGVQGDHDYYSRDGYVNHGHGGVLITTLSTSYDEG